MKKFNFIIVILVGLVIVGCGEIKRYNAIEGLWHRIDGDEKWIEITTTEGGACDGGGYEFHLDRYEFLDSLIFLEDNECEFFLTYIQEEIPDNFCTTSEIVTNAESRNRIGYYEIGRTYMRVSNKESETGANYYHDIEDNKLTLRHIDSGLEAIFER